MITMMMVYNATTVRQDFSPGPLKKSLTMSPGRVLILNAFRSGITKVNDLEKATKMSTSFIGVTLRRLV